MLVSFVLRLRSEDLERGRLAGRIEHVPSGHQQAFDDLGEVATFCLEFGSGQPAIPEPRRLGAPDGIEST